MEKVLNRVAELAQSVASPLGLAILEVRSRQQGRLPTVEVCIFRKGGVVSLDDCESVSRQIDALMEESSSGSSGSYLLEVVSPGTDRQLKTQHEFEVFTGESVRITTKEKVADLGTHFVGVLQGVDESSLKLSQTRPMLESNKKSTRSKGEKKIQMSKPNTEIVVALSNVNKVNLYSDDLLAK